MSKVSYNYVNGSWMVFVANSVWKWCKTKEEAHEVTEALKAQGY